jgi:hypothetical protein
LKAVKHLELKAPDILNKMIGLACCEARVGYGRSLVLGFGEKIFYETKFGTHFNGEWQLRTESSSWRVNKNKEILCGNYDEEEESDKLLKNLLSLKFISIENINFYDAMLTLENDYQIYLLAQSKNESHFGFFIPNDLYIEFNSTGNWIVKNAKESVGGLSEDEKLLNEHSENCFQRWKEITPEYNGEKYCNQCIFYRPLRGEFYFWDYGICSNEKSKFDASLVGVKSGCSEYKESFKEV